MDFNHVSMSYHAFLTLLKNTFKIDGLTLAQREVMTLISLSDSHLIPTTDRYPSIFAFNDIGGVSYILTRGRGVEHCAVYSIEPSKNEGERGRMIEHLDILQQYRGLDFCEWFALREVSLWAKEDCSYTILSLYGLSDCIEIAGEFDTDVAIWVEANYIDGYQKPVCGDFLKDANRVNIIFDTKPDAEAKIKSLLTSEYMLAVGELTRPTYIITL